MTTEMGGVQFAIVESNKLDEEGCIQISLQGMDGKARPYPARIAAFMAGDQRGALFLPEKGDQVLVAFVNNSINDPVVIGCLWSRVHKPPEANADGANHVKLIKTRGGNEIRLIDEGGKESIQITSPNGKIVIKGKDIVLDGDVHITGDSKLDKKLEVGTGPKTIIDKNEIKGSPT